MAKALTYRKPRSKKHGGPGRTHASGAASFAFLTNSLLSF